MHIYTIYSQQQKYLLFCIYPFYGHPEGSNWLYSEDYFNLSTAEEHILSFHTKDTQPTLVYMITIDQKKIASTQHSHWFLFYPV